MSYGIVDRRTTRSGLGYGGARYNAERMPAPDPGSELTRAAPGATVGRAGLIRSSTTPRIWGTIPVESFEGHHVDPAYDVRRARDGLSGLPRNALERSRTGVVTAGYQPGAIIPEGLGAFPDDVKVNLERLKTSIQDGLTKSAAVNTIDGRSLHEQGKVFWNNYLGAYFDASAELYDKARQKINVLYQGVIPWLNKVNLLSVGGAAEVKKLQQGSSFWYQVEQNVGQQAAEFSQAVEDLNLPSWAVPAGVGLLAFLLLRR